jgi:hypothetical protein
MLARRADHGCVCEPFGRHLDRRANGVVMAPRFFSEDGRQMFVSVGSASNDGEGMGKRDSAAIAR